ncbi:MAG: response regulator transcription factor [Verrucomicrobiae bacterium]|nr:response regulator transcription factor [Verrucomicrobiae bacterium]
MRKVTLIIAEDHPLVRRGIRGLLESQADFEVIGEADNGIEALRLIEELSPDIFISDVVMPGMTGIEVLRHTRRLNPQPRAVFMSLYDNEVYIWSALRNGANAYILKHSAADHLVPAVRSALADEQYVFPNLSDSSMLRVEDMTAIAPTSRGVTLSDRERNVLNMLADGFQSPQISSRFNMETGDTDRLLGELMKKFGAESRRDLVRLAQKRAF